MTAEMVINKVIISDEAIADYADIVGGEMPKTDIKTPRMLKAFTERRANRAISFIAACTMTISLRQCRSSEARIPFSAVTTISTISRLNIRASGSTTPTALITLLTAEFTSSEVKEAARL